MATQEVKWRSAGGGLFDTKEQAEQDEFVQQLVDVMYNCQSDEGEFNAAEAVEALLQRFNITPKA